MLLFKLLCFTKKRETAGVFLGGASSLPNPALDEGPLKMLKSLAGFRSRPNLSTAFTKAVSCRSHGGCFLGENPVLVAEFQPTHFGKNMRKSNWIMKPQVMVDLKKKYVKPPASNPSD